MYRSSWIFCTGQNVKIRFINKSTCWYTTVSYTHLRLAFQGIWSNMMRSFLTMLGIIIGIASIIAIVSTIKGTSEQIKEDLIGAGSNTCLLYTS